MSDQPPFYNHLNRPVMPEELTDAQRAILEASEAEVNSRGAAATGTYLGIEEVLQWLDGEGWWAKITTPFESPESTLAHGRLYWVGVTPHSTSGWNGSPDYHVGDVTLSGALWRCVLLWLLAERPDPAPSHAATGAGPAAGGGRAPPRQPSGGRGAGGSVRRGFGPGLRLAFG